LHYLDLIKKLITYYYHLIMMIYYTNFLIMMIYYTNFYLVEIRVVYHNY
jgi:hypothetical protein